MIVGLGLDIAELSRIQKVWEQHGERFEKRILTPSERAALPKHGIPYLAARFAAKEAAVKALGTGFRNGIGFQDIEVTSDSNGKPLLTLHNEAAATAKALGTNHFHVSLTHGRDIASAVVILERLD